jgi:YVTN family beta-propeller protein
MFEIKKIDKKSIKKQDVIDVTPEVTPSPSPTPVVLGYNSANCNNVADWNSLNGNVTSVGTNGGPSAYGTYDQNGNVFEWNDVDGTLSTGLRGVLGGAWSYTTSDFNTNISLNDPGPISEINSVGFRIASDSNPDNLSNFVFVGDAGNDQDSNGRGSVDHNFYIGKYEVTNDEYVEFLNSVYDCCGLFNVNMQADSRSGIIRTGSIGSFTYEVRPNMGNKPVVYVCWLDCARYCNWLHNGKDPTAGSTETGAYTISGLSAVIPNNNAKYRLPTQDEWYKAAYYKGSGLNSGYWTYATQSDNPPECVCATSTGDGVICEIIPKLTPTPTPTKTPTPTPEPTSDSCTKVCFRMACPQKCIVIPPTPKPELGIRDVHFTGALFNDHVLCGWYERPQYANDHLANCFLDADDYVSIGEYPDNSVAFYNAAHTTFDSIAIYPGSRLTIYSGKNFTGSIVLDVIGPALIWNKYYKDIMPSGSTTVLHDMTTDWDSGLNETFPPSKRFAMDPAKGHDMWLWANGSCKITSVDVESETELLIPSPSSLSIDEENINLSFASTISPVNFKAMEVTPTPNCCSEVVLKTIDVGHKTLGIAINQTSNKAYVSCDDNKLLFLDLSSETVLQEINIGLGKDIVTYGGGGLKSRKVVFDPVKNRIYVVNPGDDTVSVIDESTGNILTNISTGALPVGIALSQDADTLYVTNGDDCTVSVINTIDYSTIRTISLPQENSQPYLYRLAVVPSEVGNAGQGIPADNGYLIVGGRFARFFIVNLSDDLFIKVDSNADTYDIILTGLAGSLNPPRTIPSQFYVSCFTDSAGLNEGGLSGNKVAINTSNLGYTGVQGMAVSTDCSKLYCASTSHIGVLDPASNTSLGVITVEYGAAHDVEINRNLNKLYITNDTTNNISVVGCLSVDPTLTPTPTPTLTPSPTPTILPKYLCYSNEFCVGYTPETPAPTSTPTPTPTPTQTAFYCGGCEYYFDISDNWVTVTNDCNPGCQCVESTWHAGLCHGQESCTCTVECQPIPPG